MMAIPNFTDWLVPNHGNVAEPTTEPDAAAQSEFASLLAASSIAPLAAVSASPTIVDGFQVETRAQPTTASKIESPTLTIPLMAALPTPPVPSRTTIPAPEFTTPISFSEPSARPFFPAETTNETTEPSAQLRPDFTASEASSVATSELTKPHQNDSLPPSSKPFPTTPPTAPRQESSGAFTAPTSEPKASRTSDENTVIKAVRTASTSRTSFAVPTGILSEPTQYTNAAPPTPAFTTQPELLSTPPSDTKLFLSEPAVPIAVAPASSPEVKAEVKPQTEPVNSPDVKAEVKLQAETVNPHHVKTEVKSQAETVNSHHVKTGANLQADLTNPSFAPSPINQTDENEAALAQTTITVRSQPELVWDEQHRTNPLAPVHRMEQATRAVVSIPSDGTWREPSFSAPEVIRVAATVVKTIVTETIAMPFTSPQQSSQPAPLLVPTLQSTPPLFPSELPVPAANTLLASLIADAASEPPASSSSPSPLAEPNKISSAEPMPLAVDKTSAAAPRFAFATEQVLPMVPQEAAVTPLLPKPFVVTEGTMPNPVVQPEDVMNVVSLDKLEAESKLPFATADLAASPVHNALADTPSSPVTQTTQPLLTLAQSVPANEARAIRLSLHPVALGQIEIEVKRAADGSVSVSLTVEQTDTAQTLTHGLGQLRETLERAGLNVEQLNVTTASSLQTNTSQQFGQQFGSSSGQHTDPSHPAPTALPNADALPADQSGVEGTNAATDHKLLSVHA